MHFVIFSLISGVMNIYANYVKNI